MSGSPAQEERAPRPEGATIRSRVHICASDSGADVQVCDELVKHLAGLHVTHVGGLPAGEDIDAARRELLDAAHVIVLLVSADLVTSPDHDADVARALERHESRAALVVPVLCRPYDLHGLPYAHLRPLPPDGQPIVAGGLLREGAVRDTARELRALLAAPSDLDTACPFPGLEHFDEDRAADFFGREPEVVEALAKLAEPRPPLRWLQIDGPSGAGKSSFARAGVVPAVRAGRLAGGPKAWTTAVFRPGHDPLTSLAEALVKHARPPLPVSRSLDAVTRELASSPTALRSFLRESAPPGHGVLLLVDQLEEAFTLARDGETAVQQLDALLAAALDDRDGPLLLLTTIRSDFAARMGELPALERKLPTQAVRYYLRPMGDEGLRAAIEKPAERAGLSYEEGLVSRIVADASASRGALPLVAHVLQSLYTRRLGRALTLRAYDELGGVGGALAKSAGGLLSGLDDGGQDRARRLLLRLVKIGRGSEDTRQTANREEALRAAGGGPDAEKVLAWLSGARQIGMAGESRTPARLVVVSGDEGHERVDLVHEALIQRWDALGAWLRAQRQSLELRDDVEEAARIWEASGAHEDALPKGALLARFRGVELAALRDGARRYLDAAEKAQQQEEEEKRKATEERARLLEAKADAEKRAAEQKRQQEEERRRAAEERAQALRRTLVYVGGLMVVLVVAMLALGVQTLRADDAAKTARQQTEIAQTRRFVALADAAGFERFPQRQLLLAVEAWRLAPEGAPGLGVDRALADAVRGTAHIPLTGHLDTIRSAAFSPDGKRIVTASFDHTARVWSADGSGEPIVLRGHEGWLLTAAFSPDSKRIVTASMDRTARVWNADGSGEPAVLRGHEGSVEGAVFSPDGRRVLTASIDRTARVWNADGSGEPVVLRGAIVDAVFSMDGTRIVTSTSDGTARIWNADGSGEPVVLRGHEGAIHSVVFSPDGTRVVTASADRTARVWNAGGSGEPIVLQGHEGPVHSAVFSPDGELVLTASSDGTARLWYVDGFGKAILRGHDGAVLSAAFSPDGTRVLTAANDRTARVWGADIHHRWGELSVLRGHEDLITRAAFSPDGTRILTASADNTARVWNADGSGEPVALRGHGGWVMSAIFSADGRRVLTASRDKTARVWSADGSGEPVVLRGHEDALRLVVLSPDGARVLTTSADKTARVWNADGSGESVVLRGHEDSVWSAVFSPDGARVLTASADRTARVWNAGGSGEPVVLRGHEDAVWSAVLSPDGARVLTASRDKTARVWNADGSGEPIVLRGHEGALETAVFSPDGVRVLTASRDKTARVWNADGSGEPVVLRGHDAVVRTAVFSPDGSHILTASNDRTAKVWNADGSGEPVVLRGHDALVSSAVFSADGRRIVTASGDHTARVWNADGSGEPVVLRGHEGVVWSAVFSPEGKRVLTASEDQTARVWAVDAGDLVLLACARVGRNFTLEEWQRFHGNAPHRKTCEQWPSAPDAGPSPGTPVPPPSLLTTGAEPATVPSLLPAPSR